MAKNISIDSPFTITFSRMAESSSFFFSKSALSGYFVYCNGKTDGEAFDGKLEFDIKLIPYVGNPDWIEQTIVDLHSCLNSDEIPKSNADCDYCQYVEAVKNVG